MALNAYQRFATRALGTFAEQSVKSNQHLRLALMKAHINLRPEVYVAYSYLNMAFAFVATGFVVLVLVILRATGIIDVPTTVFVLLAPMPAILAATIYLVTFVLPDLRAAGRAKDIDAKLPYALNYVSTMASAGITIDRIFASLAAQPVYGEVAAEAAWISRDLRIMGRDILTALTAAIDRSPSLRFQDFIQGSIITVTSGGDLKTYFRAKSDQFAYENRQDQKKFLDTLGVMAESFVTVVVAAPLFLLVLLSVMTMFGGSGKSSLAIGYVIVLVTLPLAQLGFAMTIKSVSREP